MLNDGSDCDISFSILQIWLEDSDGNTLNSDILAAGVASITGSELTFETSNDDLDGVVIMGVQVLAGAEQLDYFTLYTYVYADACSTTTILDMEVTSNLEYIIGHGGR